MANITNTASISLPLALWLIHDDYDYNYTERYISATTLLKGTKQIIMSQRVAGSERSMDVSDFIPSRIGTAIHDSVENAWRKNSYQGLRKLGYPERVAANVMINPTDEQLKANPDIIPIWFELRTTREFNGFKVGGKFDTVMESRLFDIKSTSVWTYIKGRKDEDYQLQGSIYRWLNPELISDDYIYIQFIFTDWQKHEAKRDPEYPQCRIKEHRVKLLSIQDTQNFIKQKLDSLLRAWDLPEEQLTPCTDKELWRSPAEYKYYSKPDNVKASKNFDSLAEANSYMYGEKKGVGIVKTVPGQVRACEYCKAFPICKQKDEYFRD
jgi:hypothetical protein